MELYNSKKLSIILFDTQGSKRLLPLTHTRSVADLRIGILTCKQRWEKISGNKVYVLASKDLQPIQETIPEGEYMFIDASLIPTKALLNDILNLSTSQALIDEIGLIAGRGHYNPMVSSDTISNLFRQFDPYKPVQRLDSFLRIIQMNDELLRFDFELIETANLSKTDASVTLINPSQIYIEEGAKISHSILNATDGPIYISGNAKILEGCLIRGPFAMGEGAVLKMGSKVYGATTIGPFCTVGGEIKNTIMLGTCNKAHDGYLGDSIIGEWCNLGAGTSCSNVKNTGGEIQLWSEYEQGFISVGNKFGMVMGDYSRTAINTSINTGTVIGVCCNVFCDGLTPKYFPNFSWGAKGEKYQIEKALKDINNWKEFKQKRLLDNEEKLLREIYSY